VQVLSSNRLEMMRMPMNFTALDGKLRLDTDIGQTTGRAITPAQIADIKRLRIDRVISIVRPDKKLTYIIYPNAQSYANAPWPPGDTGLAGLKLLRTPLGHETIDGHACVKNRSVVKDQKGNTLVEATTWNASDLQNFPIQIEMQESGRISAMHFKQVAFAKPDARFFEVPAGFKQYNSAEDLRITLLKQGSAKPQAPATSNAVKPPPAIQKK
jgi:hypothetical protein